MKNSMTTKKVIAILLCAVMFSTLLPSVAQAEAPSGVWVGGTQLVDGRYYLNDNEGGITDVGTSADFYNVAYTEGHLTLWYANITKNNTWVDENGKNRTAAIYSDIAELEISFFGTNSFTGASSSDSVSYNGSYGLFASSVVTMRGEGNFNAGGGNVNDSFSESCGIHGTTLTLEEGEITATGKEASGNFGESCGILITTLNIMSKGKVTATSLATEVAQRSHGVKCTTLYVESKGELIATGGVANGTLCKSYGVHSTRNTIAGGKVTATGGIVTDENGKSYGLHIEDIPADPATSTPVIYSFFVVTRGVITAKGNTAASSKSPDLNGYTDPYAVVVSENISGTPTVAYNEDDILTYKYFSLATDIFVGATQIKNGSYYLNDNEGGITNVGASADDYNVAYKEGILTLKDANITKLYIFENNGAVVYSKSNLKIDLINTNIINCADSDNISYGIYVSAFDDTTISGSGSLTVTSSDSSTKSCGIFCWSTLAIEGGEITAIGGETDESTGSSYGVNCTNLSIEGGKVTATGGKTTGIIGSSYGVGCEELIIKDGELTATGGETTGTIGSSYGVNCTNLSIEGGKITATGGVSACNSTGVYSSSTVINGGKVTATGGTSGEYGSNYGLYSYDMPANEITGDPGSDAYFEVSGGSFTARGNTAAVSESPNSLSSNYIIKASENQSGTPKTVFNIIDIISYKYLSIVPDVLTIAGKPMTVGDYYVNGANGAPGEVYNSEPAAWNAKLEFIEGDCKLTLKGLNINTANFAEGSDLSGIESFVDLILHVDTYEDINVTIGSNGTTPALHVLGDLNVTMAEDIYPFVDFRSYIGTAISVSGDMIVSGILSATTDVGGSSAIDVGGNLEVAEGAALEARVNGSNALSTGINVAGNFTMNGDSLESQAGDGVALKAGGDIAFNDGTISLVGEEMALNKQPNLTNHPDCFWTVDEEVFSQDSYTYADSHKLLKIKPLPYATIYNVNVKGTPGKSITPVEVNISVVDTEFKENIAAETNVSNWFTNIPAGITAKLKNEVFESGQDATVVFSGTPSASADKTNIEVTVPSSVLKVPMDAVVTAYDGATWSIFEAITDDFNLSGLLTAPVKGYTPDVTDITRSKYTGTVEWSGSPTTFLGSTVYTATVTLTPNDNLTFIGVGANVFEYIGATDVASSEVNENDQIIVTITFPETEAPVFTGITTEGTLTKTLYSIGETFDPSGFTITANYDDGSQEEITAESTGYSVTPAEIAEDTTEVTIKYNEEEVETFNITVRENLSSVITPAEITGLVNGTAKTYSALTLPAKVSIVTTTADTTEANVTWDVANCTYDPLSKALQNFTIDGTITLPEGMSNVDDVSLDVQIAVSVEAVVPTVTLVSVSPETVSVMQGATQTFTATVEGTDEPDETVTWSVEGGIAATTIDEDGILTIAAAETATTLTVKATSTFDDTKSGTSTVTVLIDYEIIQGAGGRWKKGTTGTLGFTADGDYEKFESVEVDGDVIAPSDYTTESGSTIVRLNSNFLQTLSVGTHTLRVNYTDGYAETTFRIAAANPQTGEPEFLILAFALLLMASLGIAVSLVLRKRKNKKD